MSDTNTNILAGFACPNCAQFESFHIETTVTVLARDDGAEPVGDQEWGGDSLCLCPECDHQGIVADFTGGGDDADEAAYTVTIPAALAGHFESFLRDLDGARFDLD